MTKIQYTMQPIGHIRTPYKEQKGAPIQPNQGSPVESEVYINEEYRDGLSDLAGFERIWLITYLDRSRPFSLKLVPYRDNVERGVFATRSPSRPNSIGISCVELLEVKVTEGLVRVKGVDLLDKTPILDIKPYSPQFDCFPDVSAGWLDKGSDRTNADSRFEATRGL
jgi:tRNA (adenine37-N6)-methyltransferase